MLITEAFGWNYFDAKNILESWGASVSTIAYALDTNVTGCFNKPDNWTIADYLLSDVDFDIVDEFDYLTVEERENMYARLRESVDDREATYARASYSDFDWENVMPIPMWTGRFRRKNTCDEKLML